MLGWTGLLMRRLGLGGLIEVGARFILAPFGIAGLLIFYYAYLPTDLTNSFLGITTRNLFAHGMAWVFLAFIALSFVEIRKRLLERTGT